MVAEARGALQLAISQQQQHKAQLTEKQQQLAALKLHQQYLAQLQSQQQLAKQTDQLATAFAATAPQREALTASLAEIEKQIIAQRDLAAKLAHESKQATAALTQREEALDTLKNRRYECAVGRQTNL